MVDLPWGHEMSKKFVTNVGLITSTGPHGHNVMSAEWTHHVSYSPGMILISLKKTEATFDNIKATGEFGVSLAAQDQNMLASIAGNNTGKEVDKIAALKELGVKFAKAKVIQPLMVEGAALGMECKVVQMVELGDHIGFVGEVVEAYFLAQKEPIVYHGGQYFKLTEKIEKPSKEQLDRATEIIEKHRKSEK